MVQYEKFGDNDVMDKDLLQDADEYVQQMRIINGPVRDLSGLAADVIHGSSFDREEENIQGQGGVPRARIEDTNVILLDIDSPLYYM